MTTQSFQISIDTCMMQNDILTPRTVATRCSLIEKMVISIMVMMSSCKGLVLPRTAPKEIRTVAVLKSAFMILQEKEESKSLDTEKAPIEENHGMCKRLPYLKMLTLIFPSSICQMPCMKRPHCKPKAARSRLMPTLLNPYLFRKVIRKPKPMKIMT